MTEPVARAIGYTLTLLDDAFSHKFTREEKAMLRPIAETLALLDGNAFFSMTYENGTEHYEQYLPEAYSLFENNGGIDGWSGEMSWVRVLKNDSPAVVEALTSLKIALSLTDS